MSALLFLPCVVFLTGAGENEKPQSFTYVREGTGQVLAEWEVAASSSEQGATYASRSTRSKDDATVLTLRYDGKHRLRSAEVVHEVGKAKQTATLTLEVSGPVQLKRGTVTEFLRLPENPVLLLSADGTDLLPSDAFQLVKRYDARLAGKQEFPGYWLRAEPGPGKAAQAPKFSIERVGDDRIMQSGKEIKLARYRVRLREGDYLVWADPAGLVLKLVRLDPRAPLAIVVKDYAEATRELGM
jgi:hypothetical protein